MPNQPTEILTSSSGGKLLLGPVPISFDGLTKRHEEALSHVTHIVNCTPNYPMIRPEAQTFRVPVEDVDDAKIQDYLEEASDWIHHVLSSPQPDNQVYVHCETGKSRSATIVLAYRMKYCQETFKQAYTHTKTLRNYIQPKVAFVKHLISREQAWYTDTVTNHTTNTTNTINDSHSALERLEKTHSQSEAKIDSSSVSNIAFPSLSIEEYGLIYLKNHFGAYSWIPGINLICIYIYYYNHISFHAHTQDSSCIKIKQP